jgi:hypothetical protein
VTVVGVAVEEVVGEDKRVHGSLLTPVGHVVDLRTMAEGQDRPDCRVLVDGSFS